MELVILLVLIGIVIFFFRRFSSFVYFVAIVDIFLRIVYTVNQGLVSKVSRDVYVLLCKLPSNIPSLVSKYVNGIVYDVVYWIYVLIFAIFLCYVTRTFFRKKK